MAESRVTEVAEKDETSAQRDVPSAAETAAKLIAEYESQMTDVKARAQVWQRHLEDYSALKETLKTISDRVVHSSTMIPVGKKAYMEGTLVHTNEIMVLLGDNWFAERSAKQAGEVAQRRIDKCNQMLESLDKELTLIEGWSQKVSDPEAVPAASAESGEVDIREPYDEEAEAAWALEHKERVSRYMKQKRNEDNSQNSNVDEELFRRLDELELEEELDEHLLREEQKSAKSPESDPVSQVDIGPAQTSGGTEQNRDNDEKEEENEEDDWSESPPLSDEEEEGRLESDEGTVSSHSSDEDVTSDDAVNAAVKEAEQYKTVPDVATVRQSRFSVTEIISEKEVLTIDAASRSASQQHLSSQSSISNDQAGGDHVAQLKPRKRRVSFGSISERLFMKDETAGFRAGAAAASSREEEVYATVTGGGGGGGAAGSQSQEAVKKPPPDVPTIFFSHHRYPAVGRCPPEAGVYLPTFSGAKVPHDPSDIVRLYGAGSPYRLKSILKPSGSSHSLSSFDEDLGTPTTLLGGRFAVSPSKSTSSLEADAGSSPNSSSAGRFSISPTPASPSETGGATGGSRFTVSPTSSQETSIRFKVPTCTDQAGPGAAGQSKDLDHPVRSTVMEKVVTAVANNVSEQQQQPQEAARKQSRFKLSRVQV